MGNENIGTLHQAKALLSKNKLLAISFAVVTCTVLLASAGRILVPKYQYYLANASEKCQINLKKANNPDLFCTATNTVANYSDIHKENVQGDTPTVNQSYSDAPETYGDISLSPEMQKANSNTPYPRANLPPNPRLEAMNQTVSATYDIKDGPTAVNITSTPKTNHNFFLWLTAALLMISMLGGVVGGVIYSRNKKSPA